MANRNSEEKVTGYLEQIVGPNVGAVKPLYNFDVFIGRSKAAYINSSDPNVSRKQCSLRYTPDGWLIKDLGSVNGTYIDDIRIYPNVDAPLKHGCSIFFGPKNEAPEGYMFRSAKHSDENANTESQKKKSGVKSLFSTNNRAKRKASLMSNSPKYSGSSSKKKLDISLENGYSSDSSISSLDSLRTRIRKSSKGEKRRKEMKSKSCQDEFSRSEEANSVSLLDDNSIDIDPKTSDRITRSYKNDRHCDENSSDVVDTRLLKDLQRKVDELTKSHKIMNIKLKETIKENNQLTESLKLQENCNTHFKEDFKKLLEEEMTCNICTELFVKPVTLDCSHTFCKHCIVEWKKKKKQCPMCREKYKNEMTVRYMDNFISKALEQFDPEGAKHRLELMAKREEAEKAKPKGKKAKGRGRRSRSVSSPDIHTDEVDRIRSRINEIQAYTDDIQSYVDVIDDLINDGYSDSEVENHPYSSHGYCFNCGRPGHFSDDCIYS